MFSRAQKSGSHTSLWDMRYQAIYKVCTESFLNWPCSDAPFQNFKLVHDDGFCLRHAVLKRAPITIFVPGERGFRGVFVGAMHQ